MGINVRNNYGVHYILSSWP